MPKKKFFIRYFVLLAVFIVAVFWYGGTLLNMQFARAEEYKRTIQTTYIKTFVVPALRGEIFDRNGIPLITNRNIYDIVIDGKKMPKKDYVKIIIDLVEKINYYNGKIENGSLPVMSIGDESGYGNETRYSYTMVLSSSSAERARLDNFLKKNQLNINTSADELVEFLTNKYNLNEYMPPEERDPKLFMTVLGICYDFDRRNVLLGDYEYKISSDVNKVLMTVIAENSHNYPGVEVRLTYERVYNTPASAPHILGRVGPIPAGMQDWYDERGYVMDAKVGISGVESAFEEYLRGINGELERTYDQDDNLISERYIKEPVAGKDVYLTIDIKLQQVAEHSIVRTIDRIHDLAANTKEPKLNGADANAGASAVIDPNNGEVLAIVTYPSYDLSTAYTDMEVYNELSANPAKPFTNRATQGLYEPGSVFKIVTSIAALCDGKLTPNEQIYDAGKYTKYEDYQPACWLYNLRGGSHEYINVSQALEHSCNYFYFTVGERVGIDTLNKYSKHLGFGERTGIEIGETKGWLASEFIELTGVWRGGDLLQASIGQSANQFSPLQMATMLGTVLNGGERYRSHLLLCVKEYGSDEIYYAPEPEIIDSIEISEANLNAVRSGMVRVTETGSASSLFNGFPVRVGGKTGTAQISNEVSNGTFVAFAPYDKPEVSMSVVIEKGAKGTWAGFVAEDVLAYYFGYKTFEDAMDIIVETVETDEGTEE